jgi:glycine/D-amino acid oxidase-like deaminating enzyme
VERAYVGSGNVGRNTTLVRSNYQLDGNTQFFEYSLQLWEGLSHELNFNVMLSQRGQIVLAHGPSQLDVLARKGNIMRMNGINAELLDRGDVMCMLPYLDFSAASRVRHRAARSLGARLRHDRARCMSTTHPSHAKKSCFPGCLNAVFSGAYRVFGDES